MLQVVNVFLKIKEEKNYSGDKGANIKGEGKKK